MPRNRSEKVSDQMKAIIAYRDAIVAWMGRWEEFDYVWNGDPARHAPQLVAELKGIRRLAASVNPFHLRGGDSWQAVVSALDLVIKKGDPVAA